MSAAFVSRSANTVVVNVAGVETPVRVSNDEQAHLYELILTGRVHMGDVSFAQNLVRTKMPSAKQMYWVGKLINDATGAAPTSTGYVQAPQLKVDHSKILAMFTNARQHLKFPKVTLLLDESDLNSAVRFSVDRKGRNCLWINDAVSYGVTYGSLSLDTGVVTLKAYGDRIKDKLMTLVERFAADPIQVAILHGKLTGHCCFCRLPLSDERSLQSGYGDVCAAHYHLPWGKTSKMTAMGDWVLGGKSITAMQAA